MASHRNISVLTICMFVFSFVWCPQLLAATYYAAPTGSDSNPGTLERPWQTFNFAQGKLSAGDTLFLRGGTYFEPATVVINRKGAAAAPVTIQSYAGEEAVISGGLPCFMTAPNKAWKLVDPNINLYRSEQSFPGGSLGAWLIKDDIPIIQYSDAANMDSTSYTVGPKPFYIGPGLMYRDKYIYIRLEPNPTDLSDPCGRPIAPVPAVYNPNLMQMAVWTHNILIKLHNAAYIHFKDLTFAYTQCLIDTGDTTVSNIDLDHCKIKYGQYGILVRNANPSCNNWHIHDCDFTNGTPGWIHWKDVKTKPKEAYPEFQSDALCKEAMVDFLIERNVFHNLFDGMTVPPGSRNVTIRHNVFMNSTDDAMNIHKDVNNVEVAYNMFWHVASGISCLSGTGKPTGPVYIHHNVIDNSYYHRGGRPNIGDLRWRDKPWIVLDPFASHPGTDRKAWWRVYNNTIITRLDAVYLSPAGPFNVYGNPQKYVYNNIFYIKDSRKVFVNDTFSDGANYDGNIFYQHQTTYPLFYKFGDGGTYLHLADFRKANPGSDWELHGLEIDPQFDIKKINNPVYDPNIRDRYRPANPQVFTAGASYAGLNWPGTEHIDYRGAIPPVAVNPGKPEKNQDK